MRVSVDGGRPRPRGSRTSRAPPRRLWGEGRHTEVVRECRLLSGSDP